MDLPRTLDELEYHLPATHAIRFRALRGQARVAAIHFRYWQHVLARRVWWLVAAIAALGYLVVAGWLENQELTYGERIRDRAIAQLSQDNAELRALVAEQAATRPHKLIYLIEAGSTTEAKDKLSHLAMQVAGAHFELSEATTTREKK
jgi:hypothetical protein